MQNRERAVYFAGLAGWTVEQGLAMLGIEIPVLGGLLLVLSGFLLLAALGSAFWPSPKTATISQLWLPASYERVRRRRLLRLSYKGQRCLPHNWKVYTLSAIITTIVFVLGITVNEVILGAFVSMAVAANVLLFGSRGVMWVVKSVRQALK